MPNNHHHHHPMKAKKIQPSKDKTVTLTLHELAEILCSSAAKITGVDEAVLESYMEAYIPDYTPVVDFVYELKQAEESKIANIILSS